MTTARRRRGIVMLLVGVAMALIAAALLLFGEGSDTAPIVLGAVGIVFIGASTKMRFGPD